MLHAPSLYDGDNCDDKAVESVLESNLVKPALRDYELARFALHEHPDFPILAEVLVEGLDARQGEQGVVGNAFSPVIED